MNTTDQHLVYHLDYPSLTFSMLGLTLGDLLQGAHMWFELPAGISSLSFSDFQDLPHFGKSRKVFAKRLGVVL